LQGSRPLTWQLSDNYNFTEIKNVYFHTHLTEEHYIPAPPDSSFGLMPKNG